MAEMEEVFGCYATHGSTSLLLGDDFGDSSLPDISDFLLSDTTACAAEDNSLFRPSESGNQSRNHSDSVLSEGTRKRKYQKMEDSISLENIQQLLHLNLEEAATYLNVSRSTLKRVCRNHGIPKWPYRKSNKLNPEVDESDHVVSAERARNPTRKTRHLADPQDVSSKLIVKAKYKVDTMIRFRISPTTGIVELKNEVAKRLELGVGSFDIKYEDDDHDLILMACDEDLQECVDIWTSIGSGVVKLSIHDKITNSRSSCSSIT